MMALSLKQRYQQAMRRRRVPVLMQMNAIECGAACLAMVLSYYGRATRVAECRERCAPTAYGSSARELVVAARSYGLVPRALALKEANLQGIALPAIVHWNYNHFVVVERWTPQAITIIDPGQGRQVIDHATFDAAFTGVVIELRPGPEFVRQKPRRRQLWGRYLGHLRQVPGLLAQVFVASLLIQLVGLSIPLLTKLGIDTLIGGQRQDLWLLFGLGIAAVGLAQMLISLLRSVVLIKLQKGLDSAIMRSFFGHMLSLPYRFFEQRTSGDLLMRLNSNSVIREMLTSQTLGVVLDGGLALTYVVILATQSPWHAAVVAIVGGIQMVLLLGSERAVSRHIDQHVAAQVNTQAFAIETLNNIALLKSTGQEHQAFGHWQRLFGRELGLGARRSLATTLLETGMVFLQTLTPLLLLFVGIERVLAGEQSLGTMLALNALAGAALVPIIALIGNTQRFLLVQTYLERLIDVLDAPSEPIPATALEHQLNGAITLDNVSFRYDSQGPWVLENINLALTPGSKVAIVGKTGSGKSTLAKLILGLYQPQRGALLYDGHGADCFDLRDLRRQMGVVLQEPTLFSGTIYENLAFYSDASPEDVAAAARLAAIHGDIERMPMGYATPVTEGGQSLSGGQRQRLALARALVHQPKVLLLDEATSHLDVLTEAAIEANLAALRCTRIVIAHRLSTVRSADHIVVLENGAIAEQGTHDDLLARQGMYAALVRSQYLSGHSTDADNGAAWQ